MKANELMVGDWVLTDMLEQMQVCEIHEDEVMLDYNDMYDYADIQPILLNPQILEKNGFIKYLDTDDIYTASVGEDMRMYIQLIKDATLVTINIEKPTPDGLDVDEIFHFLKSDKMYVHELQHIFKLCGIDKEIEL